MSAATPGTGSPEHLLAHLGWVQALARRLVGDPELADDLAQEACVVALQRRPRDERQLRRWLASVLRNLARQRHRGDARRREREERSARREAQASTAELVEAVAAQREIVASVLELDEPYRSTVLLRYFRDLPPREIARRQGLPVNTVHSRLKRAHEKLRNRLDDTYGTRSTWSACLLPLASTGGGGAGLSTTGLGSSGLLGSLGGTLLMKLQLSLAAAVVALGAAAIWIGTRDRGVEPLAATPAASETAALAPAAASATPAREALDATSAEQPGERTALAPLEPVPAPAGVAAAAPVPMVVRGRVLDGRGEACSGVPVVVQPSGEQVATSGAGGGFRFETTAADGLLRAGDGRLVTVREGVWKRGSALDAVLVVAPRIALAGRVIAESGRPVPGATLSLRLPADFRTRFETILDGSRERRWSTRTDEDGGFTLEDVPGIEGARLMASSDGYLPCAVEAPAVDTRSLLLVLERPGAPLEGTLAGRVVDADGAGVEGARVGLGLTTVLSGADGGFAIDLARAVTGERLSAIKQGFAPAILERPGVPTVGADGLAQSGWPEFVVLALVQPSLRMGGTVLDHEGRPKAGAKVWLADPTPFAPIGMMPTTLEGLAAGAPIPSQALESESDLPAVDGDDFWDFTAPAGDASALWHWVATDGQGRFELPGLCERDYRLSVLDEDALQITTTPLLSAGLDDVVIRLDAPRRAARVAGRVVTDGGRPVPGARVLLRLPVVERGSRIRGGTSLVMLGRRGPSQRTDADGAFSFEDVPREGVVLHVTGDDVVEASFPLDEEQTLRSLELSVSVRCHLELELEDEPERADGFVIEDADGELLDLYLISHESINAFSALPLVEGSSGVVSVSSRARRLKLLLGDEVVEEHALELFPGELNRLRF